MFWLGGRDSNPDSQIQSLESYHWTTSQHEVLNLRIEATVVNQTPESAALLERYTPSVTHPTVTHTLLRVTHARALELALRR